IGTSLHLGRTRLWVLHRKDFQGMNLPATSTEEVAANAGSNKDVAPPADRPFLLRVNPALIAAIVALVVFVLTGLSDRPQFPIGFAFGIVAAAELLILASLFIQRTPPISTQQGRLMFGVFERVFGFLPTATAVVLPIVAVMLARTPLNIMNA